MKLRSLPRAKRLNGVRVLLRVDWNVPLEGAFAAEDSLKIERSLTTIRDLAERGAIVVLLTHLGRPKDHEAKLSTKHLLSRVKDRRLEIHHLSSDIETAEGLDELECTINAAKPGTCLLLENVRFAKGEEKNDPKLAARYAKLGDLFINDAFASCHRSHVSVVGIAKKLPSFAGPTLIEEVEALTKLLTKTKHPYLAFVGGGKVTTKVDVLKTLLTIADRVFIGGAMANAFFAAKKYQIGKSYVEKEGIVAAKKMLTSSKIVLPMDVLVASKLAIGVHPRAADPKKIGKSDIIVDIGPQTMLAWAEEVKKAKTIVWNGPLGVIEYPAFTHGSLILARSIAARSKGNAYGVAGGGDTLPVALQSGMAEWFDHLSTGGGAMLEFISSKGKLPGLLPLVGTSSKK
jgi:phosphoglycerate kinase